MDKINCDKNDKINNILDYQKNYKIDHYNNSNKYNNVFDK